MKAVILGSGIILFSLSSCLVIGGMMTRMGVKAAAREAHDLGFDVIVIQDACATRAVRFGGMEVSARDVHVSTATTER